MCVGLLSMRRTLPRLPASSEKLTLNSGTYLAIGATKSAGDQFRKAPMASSLSSTQPLLMVKTSLFSSREPSNKQQAYQPSSCSYMWTITDKAARLNQCKRAYLDPLSPLTSKSAVLTILHLSLAASNVSILAASAKWKSNRGPKSSRWWSEQSKLICIEERT